MPRRKRKATRGRGRQAASAGGMGRAVSTLQTALQELHGERSALDRQIAALSGALAAMGAAAPQMRGPGRPGRPGRRPAAAGAGPRPGSLKDFIQKALGGGKTMSVKDITEAVRRGGYKTRNKTLAKSVGIALTEMPMVKKVARGKFRVK